MKLRILIYGAGTKPVRPSTDLQKCIDTLLEGMVWSGDALERVTHTQMIPGNYLGWIERGFRCLEERNPKLFEETQVILAMLEFSNRPFLQWSFFTEWWQNERNRSLGEMPPDDMVAAIHYFS